MAKKKKVNPYYWSIAIGVLVLGVVLFYLFTGQPTTQVANPSAVYCEEQGYTYDIRAGPEGQRGFCVFDDGSECPGWEYYQGECNESTASSCKNLCGDGECQQVVCQAVGCPCAETPESCPSDCA